MSNQQKISPEKYIQTKARTLQVGACYVNPDWETAKLANVVIQRVHTNGNITVGVYMVDLLCRGIKDTFYFFNQPSYEIDERFDFDNNMMWEKVDYALAHNIVYAGHDFAMDYHIEPHKLFLVTKNILEEDNDEVALIEIETGDDEGKPHLLVSPSEHYGKVLAKLKRYAGEGNYTFSYVEDGDMDDEDDEDEEDDTDDPDLSVIEEGFLDFNHVAEISTTGLLEIMTNGERSSAEDLLIKAELLMRMYDDESDHAILEDEDVMEESGDFRVYQEGMARWMEANEKAQPDYKMLMKELEVIADKYETGMDIGEEYIAMVDKHKAHELALLGLFQTTPVPLMISMYDKLLEKYHEFPPAGQLFVAVAGLLLKGQTDEKYRFILDAGKVTDAYPADMRIHGLHHKFFWYVKAVQALGEGSEKDLWRWQNLIGMTGIGGNLKFIYAIRLKKWLEKKMNMDVDNEQEDLPGYI